MFSIIASFNFLEGIKINYEKNQKPKFYFFS
jgi:hypothetical protein